MLYFFEITNTKQLLGNYWIPRILVKKAFDISQVRSTLNTQFFASLSGASFYNAETQENSKNAKVEDYDRAMTGVEGASSCPPCCESRWSRGRRTSWWGWRAEDGGGGLCGLAHVSLFLLGGSEGRMLAVEGRGLKDWPCWWWRCLWQCWQSGWRKSFEPCSPNLTKRNVGDWFCIWCPSWFRLLSPLFYCQVCSSLDSGPHSWALAVQVRKYANTLLT